MPRPSKPIHPDRSLDAPATPSRQHTWSKYGEQMASDLQRASEVEVQVDDVTVIEHEEPSLDVVPELPDPVSVEAPPEPPPPPPEPQKDWQIVRSIYGRTYRRTDTAVFSEGTREPSDVDRQALGSPQTSSS